VLGQISHFRRRQTHTLRGFVPICFTLAIVHGFSVTVQLNIGGAESRIQSVVRGVAAVLLTVLGRDPEPGRASIENQGHLYVLRSHKKLPMILCIRDIGQIHVKIIVKN